jgi:hypothetical protein
MSLRSPGGSGVGGGRGDFERALLCLPLLRMCLSDVPLSLSSRALIMTCARRSEAGVSTKRVVKAVPRGRRANIC